MRAVFVIVVIFRFNFAKALVQAGTGCHKVRFTAQTVWTTALGDLLWVWLRHFCQGYSTHSDSTWCRWLSPAVHGRSGRKLYYIAILTVQRRLEWRCKATSYNEPLGEHTME